MRATFEEEYKKLNSAQKKAVDTIDGPTMVVAGPGTGKTQVLALRIANILNKTDTGASGILCLTFTNSGVDAMKSRLESYIGEAGREVNVYTFHSFGMKVVEEYYSVLGLKAAPRLLDETDSSLLFDQILNNNNWQYLRPRADSARYYAPLKSLISVLKRERITPEYFSSEADKEIKLFKKNPENVSTRGESKGELKKEAVGKIEGLERSREVGQFFDLYERAKKEKNVLDYDDVLEYLVQIVESSEDALSDIRERYLYVLIDEHQDSSAVQNEFLRTVWGNVEEANIFVVGDDRQLIYGFSGASILHFQGFRKTWKDAKLITLVDNFRSTQIILDLSHALLKSSMTKEKLVSQSKEHHPIKLQEASYPRDEIVACALDLKEKNLKLSDCALLVPKNAQVRSALQILHGVGVPASSGEALNLFDQDEMRTFMRVLKIITNPSDAESLAMSFFDRLSGIPPLEAHKYIVVQNMRKYVFPTASLFDNDPVSLWLLKISNWRKGTEKKSLLEIITIVGEELLKGERDELVSGTEIFNTVISLATRELEKNKNLTLQEFLSILDRLDSYGEHIPVITANTEGIKVLTLHSSKGLEFDYVWIAHMDERSLNSGKKPSFALPESIAEKVEERDIEAVKRKLYVAITRAKRFCTLSYARFSTKDTEQEIAKVIADLPEEILSRRPAGSGPRLQTSGEKKSELIELKKLVSEKYTARHVSVSLLNNFFECPWKWYFRNLLQLPEVKSASLEFGGAVHQAIDNILRLRKVVLPDDAEVAKIVSRWVENRFPKIADKRENEKSVSMRDNKFPLLNIYGKIDLVEYLPARNAAHNAAGGSTTELRVTDFKTGSVRKKSDIEKLDEEGRMSGNLRQLAMYSYLLQNNSQSKFKVRESRLEFLEAKNVKDSIYNHAVSDEEIELLIKDITDYNKLVTEGGWAERECHYNSYGKNTECEYCALAEIFK